MATVSTPADRRDEDILEMGRIAARAFDHVVFRELPDTRGREGGAVMSLLAQGARAGGMEECDFECIPGELDASRACLESALPGDLVVLTPSDIERTWAQVLNFEPRARVGSMPAMSEPAGRFESAIS